MSTSSYKSSSEADAIKNIPNSSEAAEAKAATDESEDGDDDVGICPICLSSPSETYAVNNPDEDENDDSNTADAGTRKEEIKFCRSPCSHVFCQVCVERILLSKRRQNNERPFAQSSPDNHEDARLSTPTLGRCPICRQGMSLFDLVDISSSEKKATENRNVKNSNNDDKIDDSSTTAKKTVITEECGEKNFLYKKNYNIQSWPIHGSSYTQDKDGNNNLSRRRNHYFESRNSTKLNTSGTSFVFDADSCYIKFDPPKKTKDGSTVEKIPFKEGTCHYHSKSCTFHGSVQFPSPTTAIVDSSHHSESNDDGEARQCNIIAMDFLLQFSRDLRYICDGYILSHKQPLDQNHKENFPIDGIWEVHWCGDTTETATIKVRSHKFSIFGFTYRITFQDDGVPQFTWPIIPILEDQRIVQRATDYPPPIHNTVGLVHIGESIQWKTNKPLYRKITWTRISFLEDYDKKTSSSITFIAPTRGVPVYKRSILPNNVSRHHPHQQQQTKPNYVENSLWGNTFCQGYRVGLASYHFVAKHTNNENANEENDRDENSSNTDIATPKADIAYISYEHPLTSQWPPLDDGSPIPSLVYFSSIKYNDLEREFHGEICWKEKYETTWQGYSKWIYDMKFDSTFSFIVSGTVHALRDNDDDGIDTNNNENSMKELSVFGNNLIYINAAIEQKFRKNLRILQEQQQQEPSQDGTEANDNTGGSDSNASTSTSLYPSSAATTTISLASSLSLSLTSASESSSMLGFTLLQHQQQRHRQNSKYYTSLSREMRSQWQSENATVRTIASLHSVLTNVMSTSMSSSNGQQQGEENNDGGGGIIDMNI